MHMPCPRTPEGSPKSSHSTEEILPSDVVTSSAPSINRISRLNHTACALTVYASQSGLPRYHARLVSGCWLALPGGVDYPLGSITRFPEGFLASPSSSSRLCLAQHDHDLDAIALEHRQMALSQRDSHRGPLPRQGTPLRPPSPDLSRECRSRCTSG